MTWQMTMTNVGRNALAAAIADENSAVVTAIALFTEQFTGSIENATTLSDFTSGGGYRCAFISPIEGQPLYDENNGNVVTGHFQVSGSDVTTNEYEAKTVVLCVNDNGADIPFMAVTVSDPDDVLIIKADVSAVTIVAMLAVENAPISSISFGPAQFVFPPATNDNLGSVRTTPYLGLNHPGHSSYYSPEVATTNQLWTALYSGNDEVRFHDVRAQNFKPPVNGSDFVAISSNSQNAYVAVVNDDVQLYGTESIRLTATSGVIDARGTPHFLLPVALEGEHEGHTPPLAVRYKDEYNQTHDICTVADDKTEVRSTDFRVWSPYFYQTGTTCDVVKTEQNIKFISWASYIDPDLRYTDFHGDPVGHTSQLLFENNALRVDFLDAQGNAKDGFATTNTGSVFYNSLYVIPRGGAGFATLQVTGNCTVSNSFNCGLSMQAPSVSATTLMQTPRLAATTSVDAPNFYTATGAYKEHSNLNSRRSCLARFIVEAENQGQYMGSDAESLRFLNPVDSNTPLYQDNSAIVVKADFLRTFIPTGQVVCMRSTLLFGSISPSTPINAFKFDGENDMSFGGKVVNTPNDLHIYLIEVF